MIFDTSKYEKQLDDMQKIFEWYYNAPGIHCLPVSALKHITKEWLIKNYNVEPDYFMNNDEKFIALMEKEGYRDVRRIANRGWCGLLPFIYTTGLCYGLDETGREGRYCYKTYLEARVALELWDGNENPIGQWLKHKGYSGEYTKEDIETFLNKEKVG